MNWQPIKTAPKDRHIMLYAPAIIFKGEKLPERVTLGNWTTGEHADDEECDDPGWISWDGGFTDEHPPTHWMPLPAPPVPAQPKEVVAINLGDHHRDGWLWKAFYQGDESLIAFGMSRKEAVENLEKAEY